MTQDKQFNRWHVYSLQDENDGSLSPVMTSSPFAASSRSTDNQFRHSVLKITDKLIPSEEWDNRVAAMQRLEELIESRGDNYNGPYPELFGPFAAALIEQMQDRRSLVSKQACRTVAVAAETFALKFESTALQIMPVIFKAQAMGMTPVTEAADICARTMIQHCPSGRLLNPLCTLLKNDRNTKLRLSAAEFLLEVSFIILNRPILNNRQQLKPQRR